MLNLLNAVDNQGGYLGGGDWSKVSKSGLSAKYVNLMEAKIWDERLDWRLWSGRFCRGQGTSAALTGVLTATGLHGVGQRSRHSGWVTARQSWQRRYTLPNLVLRLHDTQNSDLITLETE